MGSRGQCLGVCELTACLICKHQVIQNCYFFCLNFIFTINDTNYKSMNHLFKQIHIIHSGTKQITFKKGFNDYESYTKDSHSSINSAKKV